MYNCIRSHYFSNYFKYESIGISTFKSNQSESVRISTDRYESFRISPNHDESGQIDTNQYESLRISTNHRESFRIIPNQPELLWIITNQYESIVISTNQYESIRINPNQYESVRINTNQYESIGIGTNQYESVRINTNQTKTYGHKYTKYITCKAHTNTTAKPTQKQHRMEQHALSKKSNLVGSSKTIQFRYRIYNKNDSFLPRRALSHFGAFSWGLGHTVKTLENHWKNKVLQTLWPWTTLWLCLSRT